MWSWLMLGLSGWAALMVYRGVVDGVPNYPIKTYIPGFLFCLLLGPLTFVFLAYLAGDDLISYLQKKLK